LSFQLDLRGSKQITFLANLVVAAGVLFFLTQTLDAFNFPKVMVVSTGSVALVLALMIFRLSPSTQRTSAHRAMDFRHGSRHNRFGGRK